MRLVFDLSVWDVDCHNLSHHVPEEFSDVTRYCENLVREFDEGGIVGDGVARGVVISDVGIDKAMDASRNDEFGSVIKNIDRERPRRRLRGKRSDRVGGSSGARIGKGAFANRTARGRTIHQVG